MTEYVDPFEDPTPPSVVFASIDSLRGRLVMLEPVKLEHDIPKDPKNPGGAKGDRVTADVTLLDGLGQVELYKDREKTGQFLPGPVLRKVWFMQDQVVEGLKQPNGKALRGRVLCRLETYQPGKKAGRGNPWTMSAATAEEKAAAVKELARIKAEEELGMASEPEADTDTPF